ncbi:hypothetical protein Sste5346_006524 [Sporothrix stenoceras]|uniref:Xylanolytic transcriptional activator regulatory domain-containing protein n=1 Tax=Sporothrix stenoceras TaxID=5173 RepID=A0ABR3YY80_9PEZI
MGMLYSEMTPGMAPGAEASTTAANIAVPGEQQMFDDNTTQAVSMLLDMQQATDGTQMMSTQNQVYNTWNPQLHTDGPAFSFPMNWLPINLNTDLDYDSILGQSLSLMSTDLDTPFQQMPAVTLAPNLELGNTMTLAMDNGPAAFGNLPVTSPGNRSSEHSSSPASQSVRNAPQSASPRRLARGHLYANGANGARVPCTVRDKRDYIQIPGTKPLATIKANTTPNEASSSAALSRLLSLNHISVAHLFSSDAGANLRISQSTYQQIRQGIRQAYVSTGTAQLFDDSAIPSLDHLNFFVNLYFQKFNPIVPILHEHHVTTLNESWLLALAVSAIGAQYTFTEEFTSLAGVLHEILHRGLRIEIEAADNNTTNLAITQALFLSQIGLLYHGSSRLFRRAKSNHGQLVDMLRSANPNLPTATQQLFVEKFIKPDIGEFSRIILLHGVYQEIWQVKRYFDRPLSNWMVSAPEDPPSRHGASSASSSMDTASDRQLVTTEGPTYSSWRNAACDCVDVLHWAANGMIAQLSGSEHSTVFHLHFSRVVLLTPFEHIQTLARYLASIGNSQYQPDLGSLPTRSQGLAAERAIIEWAQQDEHKARLAVLHCGCFFWHIRRYSTMAFYEPVAVFMATLSIWAYSSYASQSQANNANRRPESPGPGSGERGATNSGTATEDTSPSSRVENESSTGEPGHLLPDVMDESFPSFVHLDRPNDDEMVQLFVRSGRPSVMRAYISGIGDICSPKAPVQILKEGIKILTNVSMAWGRTDRYIKVLTAMDAALAKLAEE